MVSSQDGQFFLLLSFIQHFMNIIDEQTMSFFNFNHYLLDPKIVSYIMLF